MQDQIVSEEKNSDDETKSDDATSISSVELQAPKDPLEEGSLNTKQFFLEEETCEHIGDEIRKSQLIVGESQLGAIIPNPVQMESFSFPLLAAREEEMWLINLEATQVPSLPANKSPNRVQSKMAIDFEG
uniref:Uncharacterized protein n=1 Tax=Nelumbo nucifera TaxID=4432 RepID=A0A822ZPL5_NELNU|nr:TPA_asm: hypothetical protein HUJ06_001968 [Nelumbo nucifera]